MPHSLGKKTDADAVLISAEEMENAIWGAGWDGDWFRRAYDDFGHGARIQTKIPKAASSSNRRVSASWQDWVVEDGRAEKALDSVAEHLATPHGIVLHQPAFTRYYLHLGEISSYPAGYKENAGIFCHTNPWIMIAEAMVGHGDKAHDYYTRINPSAREDLSEVHRCEPYVYAQMIAGKDAPDLR